MSTETSMPSGVPRAPEPSRRSGALPESQRCGNRRRPSADVTALSRPKARPDNGHHFGHRHSLNSALLGATEADSIASHGTGGERRSEGAEPMTKAPPVPTTEEWAT